MKRAILNVADTGPLESLVIMLRSVGYECYLPDTQTKQSLRAVGCDTVIDIDDLVKNMGYEHPMNLPVADWLITEHADLFVDVKAHRNYHKIIGLFPRLSGKVLWYRINGGKPEHVIKSNGFDCGDECNPPCPILTPNLWYRDKALETTTEENKIYRTYTPAPWADKAYACYPPFYRFDDYYPIHKRVPSTAPICLVHNLQGWGYGALIENMRKLGVKCYGEGSPDGLIQHKDIPQMLSTSLAMVHLKSSDAPGYALYEALAAACPIICTRRLIWRNRMDDLLIPDENCLVFDRETHDGLSSQDVTQCTIDVGRHLCKLNADKDYAHDLGMNGRSKLEELMWSENKEEDVASLKSFMDSSHLWKGCSRD